MNLKYRHHSKKLILLCIIPAFLTIFFIVQFTIPAVKKYLKIHQEVRNEKLTILDLKSSVAKLSSNKKLTREMEKLDDELSGFDVEYPPEFRDEVLLIDLEIFANQAFNRIVALKSSNEKEIKISKPEEEQSKSKSKKKKSKSKKQKEVLPLQILEKSFEMNTVAYYNEIIDFVTFMENYQRKVNIESISAEIFQEDKEKPNPRVDMKIQASTYKAIIGEVKDEEEIEEVKNDEKSKPKK